MEIIDDDAYSRARKRVNELKGFYAHVSSYVLVNIFLFILNWLTSPGNWWFYWPLLGWGIGLGSHALAVYRWNPFLGEDWEERKIDEFMEKERRRKG